MHSPRLLSEFCDYFLLDAHKKTVSPEEAHHSLDSAVTMYSYLEDKDYFNQHYKRSLANRLLHDTTIGTEQEDQFLMMIKQRCGAMWTRHQEAMIQDIKSSDGKHKTKFEAFRADDAACEPFAGVVSRDHRPAHEWLMAWLMTWMAWLGCLRLFTLTCV